MKKNSYFPEDEEIWKELLYWLKNPITEAEQAERKKAENDYINAILDKAFGEEPHSKKDEEPYLRYEDLLDEPKKGQTTGQAASIDSFVKNLPQKILMMKLIQGRIGLRSKKLLKKVKSLKSKMKQKTVMLKLIKKMLLNTQRIGAVLRYN